ncbi:MAG: MFS transporter [Deltaproteobacteria bacterium]|nr:MFS transporter [Deltaproteobacteria bacterium]
MDRSGKKVVAITGIAHFFAHFFELIFPAMTMYIARDLNVDVNAVIQAGFLLYLLYGVLALPWGYLADKVGANAALGIGLLIASLGSVLAGCSYTIPSLVLCLSAIGVGIASVHPTAMALISYSIPQRGKALGLFGIWGQFGMLLAPLVGGIVGYYFGWRVILIGSGLVGIPAGLITIMLKASHVKAIKENEAELVCGVRSAKCFAVLCIAIVLAGIVYRGSIVTIPVYFEQRAWGITHGLLETVSSLNLFDIPAVGEKEKTLGATILMSVMFIIGMCGQRIGGYAADRFDLRLAYLGFFVPAIPVSIAMAYFSDWSLVLASSLFIGLTLGVQPIESSLVAILSPVSKRASAYGVKFVLGLGVGAFAVWLVTFSRSLWGISSVYVVLAAILFGVVLSMLAILRISHGTSMKHGHLTASQIS